MNTFLGAAQNLSREALDEAQLESARRSSISKAICGIRRCRGRRWSGRSRSPAKPAARSPSPSPTASASSATATASTRLIDSGRLDILFANEAEIVSLTGEADFDSAVAATAARVPLLVVTRGEKGAVAVEGGEQVEVPAEPVERIVDTTGAGDLFAAGFLTGRAQGRSNLEHACAWARSPRRRSSRITARGRKRI